MIMIKNGHIYTFAKPYISRLSKDVSTIVSMFWDIFCKCKIRNSGI